MASTIKIKEISVLVILGASGDLAKKKFFPGLFGLERRCLLPDDFKIIGFAPGHMSHEDFINIIRSPIKLESPRAMKGGNKAFEALKKRLDEMLKGRKERNRLFYMTLPPSVFVPMSEILKKHCYSERGESRSIIEKPFGHDFESSRELQKSLDPNWRGEETFRVDHYLGNEVVSNVLVLRFGNGIFGAIWNYRHMDNIQISIIENGGAEGRGSYFSSTVIIRDVMQNRNSSSPLKNQHTLLDMIQILALLTMERPKSFPSDDLCDQKARVLEWIAPIEYENTIIGHPPRVHPETNALTIRTVLKRKIAGISRDLVSLTRPLPGPIQGGWRLSREMNPSSASIDGFDVDGLPISALPPNMQP